MAAMSLRLQKISVSINGNFGLVAKGLPNERAPLCPARWWPHLVGARRVHPHEHYANYPPQKDRGFARGAALLSIAADGSTFGAAHYSIRNAVVGSRRVARPAGTIDAINATVTRTATVTMSVTASRASVRTTLLCSRRPIAN